MPFVLSFKVALQERRDDRIERRCVDLVLREHVVLGRTGDLGGHVIESDVFDTHETPRAYELNAGVCVLESRSSTMRARVSWN